MSGRFCNFVGVVDSGVGGLTVLRELQSRHPDCSYVYFADSAYCPYGTKTDAEILARVTRVVGWLVSQGVVAVVLACNTASVFADNLRKQFNLPIFDVILPTCRLAAQISVTKRVALLATNATVRSGVYRERLARLGVHATSFACSDFVPFAENGTTNTPECALAVRRALKNLPQAGVDTVILGCTHFPLLRKQIARHVGNAQIVQCTTDFAPAPDVCRRGDTVYLTSGSLSPASVSQICPEARFEFSDQTFDCLYGEGN